MCGCFNKITKGVCEDDRSFMSGEDSLFAQCDIGDRSVGLWRICVSSSNSSSLIIFLNGVAQMVEIYFSPFFMEGRF